jgi:hypothetical protein
MHVVVHGETQCLSERLCKFASTATSLMHSMIIGATTSIPHLVARRLAS